MNYDGEFILDGRALLKKPSGNNVQAILEDYCLLKRKTVRENVEYPLKIRSLDLAPAQNAIREFGLASYADVKAAKFPNTSNRTSQLQGCCSLSEIYIFSTIFYVRSPATIRNCF